MNYSDQNEKHQSGFKDMAVHEGPGTNLGAPAIFFPDDLNKPKAPTAGYQVDQPHFEANYGAPPIIQIPNNQGSSETIGKLETIEMHSRIVKWTSLVLSIFSFLFLLPGAVPLVVTFVFPILGFIAAHKYSDCLAKFYSVYLVLIVIVQIIVMAALGGVAYIVFQTFIIVGELVIFIFNLKLGREIALLTLNEKNILNGTQSRNI